MDIVCNSEKLRVDHSVTEGTSPTTWSWYLNVGDGRLDKCAPKVCGIQILNGNNNESFIKPLTIAVTLKNQFYTIINTDYENYYQKEINDLASFFLLNDFLSNVNQFWCGIQWQLINGLIKTLITKFNNTKHNMVYLSSSLVCVFRKMAEKSPIPPDKIKSKLTLYIDVVRQFINHFDYALWKKWFFCHGKFVDWIFFIAGFFMPDEHFVSVHDTSIIINAMSYFKMIKHRQYIFNEQIMKTPMSVRSDIFELPERDADATVLSKEYDADRTKPANSRSNVARVRGRFVKKNTASAIIAAGDKTRTTNRTNKRTARKKRKY